MTDKEYVKKENSYCRVCRKKAGNKMIRGNSISKQNSIKKIIT